ncbi:uncharacterized protein YjiS (DUF1127 family) [Roseovarius sp. MBR-78]|jgi:uncharacterized protein YjiS (DUF1127 family)|uniref:DUF1127 domain-containing protein n=1 Tax=Roseovarius sp. MBR-78 TaxID=3156460 RepID=UPI003390FAA0
MSIHIATIALPDLRRLPLRQMREIARQRRQLARLDDAALADIGLSRREAQREAARPFWDLAGTACT